jgi:hypothetical protein
MKKDQKSIMSSSVTIEMLKRKHGHSSLTETYDCKVTYKDIYFTQ